MPRKPEKVIGYQLKNLNHKDAVKALLPNKALFGHYTPANSLIVEKLREAGVLDIWFTPIYPSTQISGSQISDAIKSMAVGEDEKMQGPQTIAECTWVYDKNCQKTLVFHDVDNRGWGWIDGKWMQEIFLTSINAKWQVPVISYIIDNLKREAAERDLVPGAYIKMAHRVGRILEVEVTQDLKLQALVVFHNERRTYKEVIRLMKDGEWMQLSHIRENTWYKKKDSKSLIYHLDKGRAYGFGATGQWRDLDYVDTADIVWSLMNVPNKWEEADMGEVQIRLTQYAVRKKLVDEDSGTYFNAEGNVLLSAQTNRVLLRGDKWSKESDKPELPMIGGYKGIYNEERDEIIYNNCAVLRPEWFVSSRNRQITSMTLNSGVTIGYEKIHAIREYIKSVPKLQMQMKMATQAGLQVSMEDMERVR